MSKMFQCYGIGQALIPVLPPPLKFETAPTVNQTNYEVGQVVYTGTPGAYTFYIYSGVGVWEILESSSGNLSTLTTDDSTVVIPTGGNINLKGAGSITTIGSGSDATVELTGLTNHAVLVGAGTTTITKLAVGSNGQVLIGATGANPAFATLTSSDGSVSFTTGANTLDLTVAAGNDVVKTITGDSGGALPPTAGNINIVGSGSITVAGAVSTETVQLTGLTNHAVLVGAGTSTITKVGPSSTAGQIFQSNGASADPSFSTATYPATVAAGDILMASGANVVGVLADVAAGQALMSGGAGNPAYTGSPSFSGSVTAQLGDITATAGNFVSSAAGNGLSFNATAASGATPVVLNTRAGEVTFTGVSIAATNDLTLTMTNSAIAGASTQVILSMKGATTGAALSIKSVTPTAGSLAIVVTNGTGATTTTADITFTFLVVN